MGRHLIYGLRDPISGDLRYVGRSSSGLVRANSHATPTALRLEDHCHRWVKGLVDEGMRPNAFCIEKWDGTGDVNEWLNERERFWIAYYRSEGCTLTNLTDGGMGLSGMKRPPEFGQLMSEKLKGRKFSDESRRRMSEGQKKREKGLLL